MIFATIEFVAHATLGTIFAGWRSGMHFPLIAIAIVWAAYPGRDTARRRYVALGIVGVYVALLVTTYGRTPEYVISDRYLTLSAAVMAAFYTIPLLLLFILQGVSAGWYMSLQEEREKSEHLLLNVLPATIAARLKESDDVIADRFDNASVLFLDIVDFTKLSASMTAADGTRITARIGICSGPVVAGLSGGASSSTTSGVTR